MRDHRTRAMLVRFTPAEIEAVRERARACGRPVARYAREVLLGATPRARRNTSADEALRQLARIGNNLNQLAHIANATERLPIEAKVDTVLAELMAVASRIAGDVEAR